MSSRFVSAVLLGISLCLAAPAAHGDGASPDGVALGERRSGWSFHEAGLIPVQSGGRVKPFDSMAREVVLFLTGTKSFQGWDPVELMLSWISAPTAWENREFIQIGHKDVKKQLGLDEKRTRFSPKELLADSYLAQYAETMSRAAPPAMGAKKDQREEEMKRVLERVGLFRNIVSGDAWPVIPSAAPAAWKTLAGNEPEGNPLRMKFAEMVTAYRAGDQGSFERSAGATRAAIEAAAPGWSENQHRLIAAEGFYNHLRPFYYAWVLYLIAALLWVVCLATQDSSQRRARQGALAFTVLAMFLHAGGMVVRSYVAGRPPVTNMYESLIWVSFGVPVFGSIIYYFQRQAVALATACTVAVLGLIAADSAPAILDPGIHPLVPVLRSNYWLTIHVLTITLSYAAFALSLGLADVTLYQFLRNRPGSSTRIATLNMLTYRAQQFGVVLLAAGTILGGVWADYSWGRFWGWDPKEVWALTALLGYLTILHARMTGWINQFTYAAWTVVGFLGVIMAWYGVNFVLGVGLHSYGFSTGGQFWVVLFVTAQLAYIGVVALMRNRALRMQRATS